jgi:hypothetical protein
MRGNIAEEAQGIRLITSSSGEATRLASLSRERADAELGGVTHGYTALL